MGTPNSGRKFSHGNALQFQCRPESVCIIIIICVVFAVIVIGVRQLLTISCCTTIEWYYQHIVCVWVSVLMTRNFVVYSFIANCILVEGSLEFHGIMVSGLKMSSFLPDVYWRFFLIHDLASFSGVLGREEPWHIAAPPAQSSHPRRCTQFVFCVLLRSTTAIVSVTLAVNWERMEGDLLYS